jgi:excisionase family DNA binding protein
VIGLQEAADRLGVHYMTVYRYVRTGRLPAVKAAGEWLVERAAVDRLRAGQRGRARMGTPRRAWARSRMLGRLLAGDEVGAWLVVEAALASGAEPAEVHLELLVPALQAVGDGWERGEITVADEHRASAVARRIIGRLGPRFTRPGRKRGTVVLGAVAGERHEIPGAIVADHLRAAGFEVVELGADTPAESFVESAGHGDPLCILVSVTAGGHEDSVVETVEALRASVGAPVLVGGAAVGDEGAARALGSERWTGRGARDVVAAVEDVIGRRGRR